MTGAAFLDADLSMWVKAAGVALTASFGLVSGYRVQLWLCIYVPGANKLYGDLGPAVGLVGSITWLLW